ncbi:MAG TPA: hypothetical protein DD437_09940 [Rhodobiaceae bacterium]|nr:hypothetical protein [Rhodobiaceae bacterium]
MVLKIVLSRRNIDYWAEEQATPVVAPDGRRAWSLSEKAHGLKECRETALPGTFCRALPPAFMIAKELAPLHTLTDPAAKKQCQVHAGREEP